MGKKDKKEYFKEYYKKNQARMIARNAEYRKQRAIMSDRLSFKGRWNELFTKSEIEIITEIFKAKIEEIRESNKKWKILTNRIKPGDEIDGGITEYEKYLEAIENNYLANNMAILEIYCRIGSIKERALTGTEKSILKKARELRFKKGAKIGGEE